MVPFERPEHRAVATALRAMDHDLLTRCACWFGGGTEIVLDLGEYRLSKDIDFALLDGRRVAIRQRPPIGQAPGCSTTQWVQPSFSTVVNCIIWMGCGFRMRRHGERL